VELIEVQMALANMDSRLVTRLEWIDHNGFIKAFPRRKLSAQAHTDISRFFKSLGGRFVWHNGASYFELAKQPRAQNNKIAEACKKLVAEGIFGEAS